MVFNEIAGSYSNVSYFFLVTFVYKTLVSSARAMKVSHNLFQ